LSIKAAKETEVRRWIVLGTTLAVMFAGAVAFGETPTPCRESYLMSGLTDQQMSFEEFRRLYRDDLCPGPREHE
jgi:hypothetical protein